MPGQILILASCAVVIFMGSAHLALTFFSHRFEPRDARLGQQLRVISPVISPDTTMWQMATGFHISHSMGPILFGLIYGYLALAHFGLLLQSTFLLALGALTLLTYLVTAKVYWFKVPRRGITLALLLYLLGAGIALN